MGKIRGAGNSKRNFSADKCVVCAIFHDNFVGFDGHCDSVGVVAEFNDRCMCSLKKTFNDTQELLL